MDAKSRMSKRRRTTISDDKKTDRKTSISSLHNIIEQCDDDENIEKIFKDDDIEDDDDLYKRIKLQKSLIDHIKLQPWPIKKKLKVISLAKRNIERYEGKLSRRHGCVERCVMTLNKAKKSLRNLTQLFIPWEMKIKAIESRPLWVCCGIIFCISAMAFVDQSMADSATTVLFNNSRDKYPHESVDYKTIPKEERQNSADLKTIWEAEGVVKYSPIFYGYFGNDKEIGNNYRLPLAYLVVGLAGFAFSFVVVLRQMASNSRRSGLSNKEEHFTFSSKLFNGWDYTIGHTETSNNKRACIATGFKESIEEERHKKVEQKKYVLILCRVVANIIVLLLLALSTYIIQLCVERSREVEIRNHKNGKEISFWEQQELTVIMTLISTLFPTFFDIVSLMEKYHPRVNLKWQLARIFGLNLLNMYTLFIALYWKQEDMKKEMNNILLYTMCNETSTTPTSTAKEETNCTSEAKLLDSRLCWETMIGQEIFKLTIMDLVFVVGTVFIQEFLRGLFIRYFNVVCFWDMEKTFPEYADFKTAENILHLISNQGVIWLGTFFAPGLPLLNLVKLFILLYLRSWAVLVCNSPHEGVFRASRSNNTYYALLLVMLFLSMLPPLFAIVTIEPSPHCGPFSGQKKMFEVISRTIDDDLPSALRAGINYAASPGVILPVLMLLGMTIYFLLSVNRGLKESNKGLRKELNYERTEGKEKIYAMANVKRDIESGASLVGNKKYKNDNMSSAERRKRLQHNFQNTRIIQPLYQRLNYVRNGNLHSVILFIVAYSVIAAKRIAKLLNKTGTKIDSSDVKNV